MDLIEGFEEFKSDGFGVVHRSRSRQAVPPLLQDESIGPHIITYGFLTT